MIRRFALAMSALAVSSIGVAAQQTKAPEPATPPIPAIEVSSVKLSNPNAAGPLGQIPIILPQGPGRITTTNTTLRWLIRTAYSVQDFQIVGGPAWMNQQRFDIVAKAEGSAGATDTALLMPLLKAVVIERFKLKTHTEKQQLPIEKLMIARSDGKLGPNLKPSTSDCKGAQEEQQKRAMALLKGGPGALLGALPKPGEPCSISPIIGNGSSFGLSGNGQSLNLLVQLLTQVTGKTVEDRTGLTGLYDFDLKFDPEVLLRLVSQMGINIPAAALSNLPQSDSPSLMTAIREQLGLKLESDRGLVEVLVIDSAEMPTPD